MLKDSENNEIILDNTFSELDYNKLDMDLVQHFEFHLNFLVSDKREGTLCSKQLDFSDHETVFSTNIPLRIFRISELKLSFNTINY